jgi:glycine hydroxymethyltransferase
MQTQRLMEVDPDVVKALDAEMERQTDCIELIASENYTSAAVMEAQGTVMTNKYAEGYPGARYYGGCEYVDVVESLAIERAKKLFGADHANVQPHSGTQANMAAYMALLEPGDRVLALDMNHGGHLSHGNKVNFSGRFYDFHFYGVDKKSERITFDMVAKAAREVKPKLIVTGASAYPRIFDFRGFQEIAHEVGAYLMADMAHIAGLVAAGLHPDPVPFCEVVTGTTHKTMRGPRGGIILCKAKWEKKINSAVFPGVQGGPLMHAVAGKAVSFKEALTQPFRDYQYQILQNAKSMADELLERGYRLVTGGTDNHLLLVDLRDKNLTGRQAELALEKVRIAANKNLIPFDPRSAKETSGIRIGSPAATTRGMKESEMRKIISIMDEALKHHDDEKILNKLGGECKELSEAFPIYKSMQLAYRVDTNAAESSTPPGAEPAAAQSKG